MSSTVVTLAVSLSEPPRGRSASALFTLGGSFRANLPIRGGDTVRVTGARRAKACLGRLIVPLTVTETGAVVVTITSTRPFLTIGAACVVTGGQAVCRAALAGQRSWVSSP